MDISVVMSTFNRSDVLGMALESLAAQQAGGLSYEVVIVDNNSTDDTRRVVENYMQRDSHIRYIFEKRQGLAYGRNAGIAAAKSDFIAFCDDDIIVPPDWVQKLHESLAKYRDADFIGGKVLPLWKADPPAWMAGNPPPLALQDYGEKPEVVSLDNQRCLIGACLAMRRRAFERAGYFDTATQRVGNSVGSTEDHEWEMKVWLNGGIGVYVPDVVCYAEIPADRMVKSYHRRWHLGHGKFSAIAPRPNYEGGAFQLLGVPAFVYRQLIEAAARYLLSFGSGRPAETFHRENQVFFFAGFILERWKRTLSGRRRAPAFVSTSGPSVRSADRS
jgi:glycosyltransferase involved in cell wall biosynthesis